MGGGEHGQELGGGSPMEKLTSDSALTNTARSFAIIKFAFAGFSKFSLPLLLIFFIIIYAAQLLNYKIFSFHPELDWCIVFS